MTDLTCSPSVYERDRDTVLEMLIAYRMATSVRVYPTTWRLKLLWSSRVWEPELDTLIWLDKSGRAAGFAMLWRRVRMGGYLVLERVVNPALVSPELVDEMLGWGIGRANQIAAKQVEPLKLFANALTPGVYRREHLMAYGFELNPPDPNAHNLYFSRDLEAPFPAVELPGGYQARPLNGRKDLDKYDELYGFAVVDIEHRRDLLASEEYSVLVVEDNLGALVAYCESSISRAEWEASGERIGWIDYIETAAKSQGRGLGRAILLASLARLRSWGTDTAMLVTVSSNVPAIKLYQAAGFERVEVDEVPSYQMDVPVGGKSS